MLPLVLSITGIFKKLLFEDAARLRKTDDDAHNDVGELEAAVKGIDLALKCTLSKVVVIIAHCFSNYPWMV